MKLKLRNISTKAPMLLGGILLTVACQGATFEHEVKPRKNDGFNQALFRLWLPDDSSPVRGLIVESGQGGKAFFLQPEWQEFARKHQLAMLSHFVTGNIPTNKEGYEQGPIYEVPFTQALQELATASKHPEIQNAPMLTFGPCHATAGGFFPWRNKTSSSRTGQRVVAFAAAGWYQNLPSFATARIGGTLREIPGLLLVPQTIDAQDAAIAKSIFAANRKQDAPWALAAADFDKAKSDPLIRAFFEAVWTKRVPPPAKTPSIGPATGGVLLKPADESNAWLGDLKTKEISSSIAYLRQRCEAAWLPDEASAKLWQAFISGQ